MKNILCPTDFSSTSLDAIAYAAKLAQVTHSELTLLNVQSLFDVTPVEILTGKQYSIKATTDRLHAQCREVGKVYKIVCTAEVEPTYRKLSAVIRDKADHFDLVVMGSNGPDDLYQFFWGTNTYNALAKSRTPLLLIPESYLYGEIKHVLYAFDYLRERKLPIGPLQNFVKTLNGEVTVLQVMEEAYSKKADEDLKELQFILQTRQPDDFPLKYTTIRSDDVAGSINQYILEKKPDLLALCSQNRNFIESMYHKSVIKDISTICDYPVFVFRE